jgi:hypothetical protein
VEAEDHKFKASPTKIGSETLSQKQSKSWVLVAHSYNPSYLGGLDQEDFGSRPAWSNILWCLYNQSLTFSELFPKSVISQCPVKKAEAMLLF